MKVPTIARYSFRDDYSEGAHPAILDALFQTNLSQQHGYGEDEYCEKARTAIRSLVGAEEATIYFTLGGTGANLLSIASHLQPHEAVISAESGHIVGKEAGAIETTGHCILVETGIEGKLTAYLIQSAVNKASQFEYQVKPRMVFISNASEFGTIYTKSELKAISAICKKLNLLLFMDDIFWIGGTKNGALLGEAIVIKDQVLANDFPRHMKQRGALLAKGRILGIQFSTLFQDDLFFRLARHSNDAATKMSSSLTKMGYELWTKTESNQVFIIFPSDLIKELQKEFDFYVLDPVSDGELIVRLVTSWATEMSEVERFCKVVEKWKNRQ